MRGYLRADGRKGIRNVVVVGYLAGRLLEGLFLLLFSMETHCWRPIDTLFRTITARRNPRASRGEPLAAAGDTLPAQRCDL